MSFLDSLLNKAKLMPEDDDYEDFDDEEMDDEIYNAPTKNKTSKFRKNNQSSYDTVAAAEEEASASKGRPQKTGKVVPMKATTAKQSEVCMIMPKGYQDANEIADILLQGKSVVLNLEGMNVDAAQRVIDFASGACYTMGGNLQKISKKIFIVTPSSVELSGDFTNLLGDTIDLSSLNLNM